MTDEDIQEIIDVLRGIKAKFDRQQRFNWMTRHLSREEKIKTEKRMREMWSKQG